jgi:hypothetical protein
LILRLGEGMSRSAFPRPIPLSSSFFKSREKPLVVPNFYFHTSSSITSNDNSNQQLLHSSQATMPNQEYWFAAKGKTLRQPSRKQRGRSNVRIRVYIPPVLPHGSVESFANIPQASGTIGLARPCGRTAALAKHFSASTQQENEAPPFHQKGVQRPELLHLRLAASW